MPDFYACYIVGLFATRRARKLTRNALLDLQGLASRLLAHRRTIKACETLSALLVLLETLSPVTYAVYFSHSVVTGVHPIAASACLLALLSHASELD